MYWALDQITKLYRYASSELHFSNSLTNFLSQRPRAVNIDNRPESVVRVEGIHVHALFNFLLNSKVTVATTGAHAGVPPTLLAPVGFEGASLKSLKVGSDKGISRH